MLICLSFVGSSGEWAYQWYVFPFQFCSTPMYVCLLASLVKKGKFQDCLFAFLATFSIFGGLSVMLMPGDVFMSFIGINIQTMVHHGGMIIVGVVMYTSRACKLEHKSILKAGAVFLSLVSIAVLLNCVYVWGGTATCNLFYISPFFPSTLPVFSTIYTQVPYVIFLLLYVLSFIFIAYVILLVAMLINKLINKNRKNNKSNIEEYKQLNE